MTQPIDVRPLLEQAASELKKGNKPEAQRLLAQAVGQDPNNSSAWYGLAIALDDTARKKECLRRVLVLNPRHERARAMLAHLETPAAPETILAQKLPVESAPAAPPEVPLPAPQRKKAGASTREMERDRWNRGLKIGLIGLGLAILILIIFLSNPEWIPAPVMLGLFVLVLALPGLVDRSVDRKLKESRRAGRGAAAEEKIGELLAELGPDFEVLHDVECRYGNIDHLVISAKGAIFMIETKSHHGTITAPNDTVLVNGHKPEKDFIAQSLRNSFWLRDQIEPYAGVKPWVTAILVFTNGFVKVRAPVKGVIVTNKKYLLGTIRKKAVQTRPLPGVWQSRDKIIRLLGKGPM